MGKTTGFMEYKRRPLHYRDPSERINDWQEIASLPSEDLLQEQAARCMDCAVPFCQNGSVLAGMTTGCPVYNLIPEWNDLVFKGRWKEAYLRLKKTNPFPEFTGRACPAPCEGGCVASLYESAVSIKNIERAIIDKAFEEGWVIPAPPKKRTGKKVAVIGSGPAGLASASQLNLKGHSVTVYERNDRIGGLLTYGIPKMKIEQKVINRRLSLLEEEGIQFITNVEIGKQVSMEELRAQYDAVILCIGATRPRDVQLKGRELQGIHFAMDFLHSNTKSLLDSNFTDGRFISAQGKDVIVIGGGDTASDCISTALRQNCKSLVQFDIYPERPKMRTGENPWPQYPIIHKMDTAQEEASYSFGKDPRSYSTSAVEFLGNEQGAVSGIMSRELRILKNERGEKKKEEVPLTEKIWPTQLVLLAIGFEGPETPLVQHLQENPNEKYATNEEGIFIAGDARRGQSLIVWAIQEGKEVADQCDRYLQNKQSV
ncbi:glutamate synthase (NADPH/NADH) small chain [Oikeobacillus pervagus]|uniref:Glutamate synthase (NADPH/NADH) small chain n=1 Tax=Oikeobacillus pervagus TaxID=1325931 RepID=A0AAJ1WLF0_9BACI|nr:glutamate synthase subunit beta [Oikeobacillus pervagus]MDQ0216121.1 glutamate synthase (NADPH/NADH) small chain [Oikeobacillus pervagus]